MDDTIAAIATSVGQSAIGIIKISGPSALSIAQKLFRSRKNKNILSVPSHTLHYGFIVNPKNGQKIDEVLLAVMRGPHTYTREDVVEINCHGGRIPLYKTLDLVLEAGARLAEPGEFTKRAFLNGRVDLTQAEAVIDLITAQSEQALHLLVNTVEGNTFKPIYALQKEVEDWQARIEAELNFPQDLSWSFQPQELLAHLDQWTKLVDTYLNSYESSKFLIEGMKLVIAGKANVGKSSLMNQILQKERSIITSIPGTTTDVIEDSLYLKGILVRIMDTAGFGKVKNEIEREGIRRSQQIISQADLILLVFDGSQPLDEHDLLVMDLVRGQQKKVLLLVNKSDLDIRIKTESLIEFFGSSTPLISVSALTGEGICDITRIIADRYLDDQPANLGLAINLRQKGILAEIRQSLTALGELIRDGQPDDQVAEEFRLLSRLIRQLRGDLWSEDLIDQIFEKFCIGK
ncbi:MAG: tRNA uridine-5-carboxymethylaminomethyl(34) synthesis GTPase MnmE [bacterium]|nr:tRNA uridine-5-carboxymethylaminomethyl(34) synthesis GTPase MnmE [bacterium]